MSSILPSYVPKNLLETIRAGEIAVIPTDTQYGLITSADDTQAVEKLYELKGRDDEKPFIVLIEKPQDVEHFGIEVSGKIEKFLKLCWPGPVSIIFSCPNKKWFHLHRGSETLAIRCPEDAWLSSILQQTGPLVAPSANPQGETPASTIEEAKKYFREKVKCYVDGKIREGKPSTLIQIIENEIEILRAGAYEAEKLKSLWKDL